MDVTAALVGGIHVGGDVQAPVLLGAARGLDLGVAWLRVWRFCIDYVGLAAVFLQPF